MSHQSPGDPPTEPPNFYARNRAWSHWTYETVGEALDLFAPYGTFNDLLNFFGSKRRALALAYRSHEAELFGRFRDALPPEQRTRTTFFGPACPPYERVVAAYQALYNIGDGTPFKGIVRAALGADTFELTSFQCDAQAGDPRARMWLHTHWIHIAPILNHCRALFERALEPLDETQRLHTCGALHWWLVHAMPFARGSTSIAEWVVHFICRMHGAGSVKFFDDPAAVAFVAPSVARYVPMFAQNLEIIPGLSAARIDTPSRRLAHCARTGKIGPLRRLLRQVDANTREPTGYTPLLLAAAAGERRCVHMLLRAGAKVTDVLVDSLETPLQAAARAGHARIVRRLTAAGADAAAQDTAGSTALHWAVREGHAFAAWCLLRAQAPTQAIDAMGRLPLHYAADRGHVWLTQLLTANKYRHAINALDIRSETPLSLAALQGHTRVMRLLLRRGARPPPQDAHLLAIKLGQKAAAVLALGVNVDLYALLLRVVERQHRQAYAVLKKRLLAALPRDRRRAVTAHLPDDLAAPP